MPSTSTDWFCIVNPHAGSGKTLPEWAIAEKYLAEKSVAYKTVLTNYKFHATELACEAARDGYRRFLAVGGDGSVHEVLNGILRFTGETGVPPEDFTLAVIPIGSGNDWIKSLGIPHDTRKVVELLAGNRFARQDVVRVETAPLSGAVAEEDGASRDPHASVVGYMANIGGVGFDSRVCERVNALKERGKRSKLIYLGALLQTLFTTRAFRTRIVADGETVFEGEVYSVAFGNGRYSGGGMRQVPLSEIDDGLLDYMIVPKAPLLKLLTQLPRLYNGTANESGLLISGRCRELEMTQKSEENALAPLEAARVSTPGAPAETLSSPGVQVEPPSCPGVQVEPVSTPGVPAEPVSCPGVQVEPVSTPGIPVEMDGEIVGRLPLRLSMTGSQIRVPVKIL